MSKKIEGSASFTFSPALIDSGQIIITEPAELDNASTDRMGRNWTLQIKDTGSDKETEIVITEEQAEKIKEAFK